MAASALRSFWPGGFFPYSAFLLGPIRERRRTVLEVNNEFLALLAVLLGDEVMALILPVPPG